MFTAEQIKRHETLLEQDLIIYSAGADSYAIHKLEVKRADCEAEIPYQEYLVFTWKEGRAVSNWKKQEYDDANKYFPIGDHDIYFKIDENDKLPVEIPKGYRNM